MILRAHNPLARHVRVTHQGVDVTNRVCCLDTRRGRAIAFVRDESGRFTLRRGKVVRELLSGCRLAARADAPPWAVEAVRMLGGVA